ncbi:Hypothetical protein GLP15_4706 [Giardia lamblia P15]|uniref:Uncharacterized protein n=1 Tax=Giardia intestinalis (strain P15) TaxID=658858 RepID=E1F1Q2_GIAIA|nr:Hypothetical protein GLP15_4706 [Giardia lamblia P15]
MPDLPGAQEQKEEAHNPPQFRFGFVPANTDDKDPAEEKPTSVSAPASDFKFSFGYVPDQEPPRKSFRSHGHIDKQTAEPESSLAPKSATESKKTKTNESSESTTKENTAAFAFSFTGIAACKPLEPTVKAAFSFPNMGPSKADDNTQGPPATEHNTSLVSAKNYTTTQSVDKKDYQNKNSLFEGGDVELYHYDKEDGKWIAKNKGYLQIISVEGSPEDRQLVFSRVGTSIVAINSRLTKEVSAVPDKKRYLKIAVHNDLTKTSLIALFKFATEELRDSCLAAMPQKNSNEGKPEERTK